MAGAAITDPPKVSYVLDTDPKYSVKACDVANVLSRSEHFARDLGGLLHVYRNGVYVPDGKQTVARLVLRVIKVSCREDNWSTKLRDETIAYITDGAPVLPVRPPMDVVNLRNGLLYVRAEERDGKLVTARTLKPHSPEFLSTIQLPIEYAKEAPAPEKWLRFITDVFPDDCVKAAVIWYIIAYLILPNTVLHKALLFMSEEGGTGKSTLLKALTALLGPGNVSHESIQDLEENRFRAASMLGKLMNTFADLRGGVMNASTMFKVTVAEDPISAERKFAHPFEFLSFARQIYSTNNFPVVRDASDAFFRRWWVCKFVSVFSGTTVERSQNEILAELCAPQELSGVLNEALKVLPYVLDPKRGGIPEPPSCVEARKEFEAMTSPVAMWLAKRVTAGSDKRVEKQLLREAYNRDAIEHGRPALSDRAFTGYLKRTFKSQLREHRDTYGSRHWYWVGIGLLEVANEEAEVEVA